MYQAIVSKLTNIRKHSNADRLMIATCYGNQVIIGLDHTEGELGIYFPTDGRLSEQFCKENNLIGYVDEVTKERKGGFFDTKRKVRTQKFRGEKSDGFWIPLSSVAYTGYKLEKLTDGTLFDTLNDIRICEKYVTEHTRSHNRGTGKQKKKKKSLFPFFKEHYDTAQLAYNLKRIPTGALISITEKVHGTSARDGYLLEELPINMFKKVINKVVPLFTEKRYNYICGTRRVVLDDFNNPAKAGFYGTNDFRKIHHDKFVGNIWKGETFYYEIVGWIAGNTPVMGIVDVKVTKDKELITRYGEKMVFKYGCAEGTSDIYIYRITMTNDDGKVIEYPWYEVKRRCKELGLKHVVEMCEPFIFDGDINKLVEKVESHFDGPSTIDQSHHKEGVCVRVEHENSTETYKSKNFIFKLLEGIVKEKEDSVDIEEQQDVIAEEEKYV